MRCLVLCLAAVCAMSCFSYGGDSQRQDAKVISANGTEFTIPIPPDFKESPPLAPEILAYFTLKTPSEESEKYFSSYQVGAWPVTITKRQFSQMVPSAPNQIPSLLTLAEDQRVVREIVMTGRYEQEFSRFLQMDEESIISLLEASIRYRENPTTLLTKTVTLLPLKDAILQLAVIIPRSPDSVEKVEKMTVSWRDAILAANE